MNELQELTNAGLHQHLQGKVLSLAIRKDVPILDLGCGTGAWLARLAELGYRNLVGVDIREDLFGAHQVAQLGALM